METNMLNRVNPDKIWEKQHSKPSSDWMRNLQRVSQHKEKTFFSVLPQQLKKIKIKH